MKTKCIELLTDLFTHFVSVDAYRKCPNVLEVDFKKRENQKKDELLFVGHETNKLLKMASDDVKCVFFESIRAYYVEACSYIKSKFPLENELLTHAEVADISKRKTVAFDSVQYFLSKFNVPENKVDLVQRQFNHYQFVDRLDTDPECRIDEKWAKLQDQYPDLSKVMLAILSIAHGNADSERVFSTVRHVDTDFRQAMDMQLMEPLIITKRHLVVQKNVCYTYQFTDEFLAKAKSATYQGLTNSDLSTEEGAAGLDGGDVTGQILQMISGDMHMKK